MKILHIAPLSGNKSSGLYYSIPKLVENQNRILGTESELFNSTKKNENNVDLGIFDEDFKSKKDFLDFFLSFDIFIFHSNYVLNHLRLYNIIKRNKRIYIITPRGGFTTLSKNKKKIKKLIFGNLLFNGFFKNASAYHYLSNKEMYNSKLRSGNDVVIPNGVDIIHCSKKRNTEKIKIVYIGRIDVYTKGIDLLINTLCKYKSIIEDANISFDLYGPIGKKDYHFISAMIREHSLQKVIKFNPPVYGHDKNIVYKEADGFIQLSRYEGFSMGILEALNNCLPCILTKGTNLSEEVEDYNVGLEVSEKEEDIFQGIMKFKELLINENFEEENYNELLAKYKWSNIAEQTITFYRKIIAIGK